MFLNPWYGQVGAGPATEDESTAAQAEATPATLEVNQDAGVKDDSTTVVSSATVQESTTAPIPSAKPESDAKVEGSAISSAPPSSSDQPKPFQNRLKCGWTAHMTQEGRLFYCK